MDSSLKLIAATPDMRDLLTGALAEHGVGYHSQGEMVVIDSGVSGAHGVSDAPERVPPEHIVALLRDILSPPEREAVSVVEELDFPREFPVTTRLEAWWSVFETSWFEKAMTADSFSIWFQPVVDTAARKIVGHECLLRLTMGHRREAAEIMAAASARRDLRGFDAYTRRLAIHAIATQRCGGAEKSSLYFLNLIPSVIYRPAYCMRDTLQILKENGLEPKDLVLETVESNRNPDVGHLRRIANYLREEGLGFALDDIGADAEALRLIIELRPDYIKLHKHLVHRMEQPRYMSAVRKLVEVAERFQVRVVAKGVERVATMQHLQAAGVHCMQGYLFGSPAPEMAAPIDVAHLATYAASQVDTGFSLSDRARFEARSAAFREPSHGASSSPPESATQELPLESPVHSHAGH